MKTILFPTMIVMAIAASEADVTKGSSQDETYCVETRGAKTMVIYGSNRKLEHEITLDNGSRLKPDGVLIRTNGRRVLLQENECVMQDGTVIDGHIAQQKH